MAGTQNHFEFSGAIVKGSKRHVSLCLEVGVASQARTVAEAKKMLAHALTLYLQTCFENGIPYFRPIPNQNDPQLHPSKDLVEIFELKGDFEVHTLA